MNCKKVFLTLLLSILGINMPAFAQENLSYWNSMPTETIQYNPSTQTIQYYPPELGSNTRKYNRTAPTFYQVPSRIEPNIQPNPLKDELEKTNYV